MPSQRQQVPPPPASQLVKGNGLEKVELQVRTDLPLEQRASEALRLANEAFALTGYWVSFYRAVLGVEGVVDRLFTTREEQAYFQTTQEFAEIFKILAALRSADVEKAEAIEPQRVLTIRMPVSLHASLAKEAKMLNVSMNKLCLSKFALRIKPEFVPIEQGRPKGRKPQVGRRTLTKKRYR